MNLDFQSPQKYHVYTECIHCGGPVGLGHGDTGVCSWCIVRKKKFRMRQKTYFARERDNAPRPE